MNHFDLVIVGGGIVGLSLACGLKNSGLRIAVIEKQVQSESLLTPSIRVSAFNLLSERFFQYLGLWEQLLQYRATPFYSTKIWQQDSSNKINFTASDFNQPHLGYIIENNVVITLLQQMTSTCNNIKLITDDEIQQLICGDREVFLTTKKGHTLTTPLLIGADGAHSQLRQEMNIPLTFWDYQHQALIATVETEQAHDYYAYQVFNNQSILAFLPREQPNCSSIVWSLPPQLAVHYQNIEPDAFEKQLSVAFDLHLGRCKLLSPIHSFHLTARYSRSMVKNRVVLIGDAAHTIHPLAGQGVNLGLADVVDLITHIKQLKYMGKDLGLTEHLRPYERKRKFETIKLLAAMEGIKVFFTGQHALQQFIRTASMQLIEELPLLKGPIIKQALGIDQIPDWITSSATHHTI